MSSLVHLLLLCLSLYACTARPLTAAQYETQKYHFHKDADRMIWLEKANGTKLKQKVVNGSASYLKQLILGTTSGAKFEYLPQFLSTAYVKSIMVRGIEVATSVQIDLPFFFRKKELRRHARSMLEPAHSHDHVEQTVTPNSGDAVEDIVEMDYAQPHKKPPIHNEKP